MNLWFIAIVALGLVATVKAQGDLDFLTWIANPTKTNIVTLIPAWDVGTLTTELMCALPGVECDGTSTWPVALRLDGVTFSATIPTMSGLTGLKILELTNCVFLVAPHTDLPSTLELLNMHGSIAPSLETPVVTIDMLSNLVVLNLTSMTAATSGTYLTMPSISAIPAIETIAFSGSQFAGTFNLTSTTLLNLDIAIDGPGVFNINAPNLATFSNVHENQPLWYGQCNDCGLPTSLTSINFAAAEITQDIFDSTLQCTALQHLYLIPHLTQLTPIDVTGLASSSAGVTLTHLAIHNIPIAAIPQDIGALSLLTTLSFNGDDIGGSIPASINLLQNLVVFSAIGHHFVGTIPSGFSSLANLQYLILDSLYSNLGNECVGRRCDPSALPEVLCTLATGMKQITINGVYTGPLPTCLPRYAQLQVFSLASNSLTGTIPANIGQLTALVQLSLEHNMLTGALPSLLGLTHLRFLDIHNNDLSGTLSGIESLSIIKLDVSGNSFHSTIPSDPVSLIDCNVDGNCFESVPPVCTGAMTAYCPTTKTCLATNTSICYTCDVSTTGATDKTTCQALVDVNDVSCVWCRTTHSCGTLTDTCPASCASFTSKNTCNVAFVNDVGDAKCAWCGSLVGGGTPGVCTDDSALVNCPYCASATTGTTCAAMPDRTDATYAMCVWCTASHICNTTAQAGLIVCPTCSTLHTATTCSSVWSSDTEYCGWCVATRSCLTHTETCPVPADATTKASCESYYVDNISQTKYAWCPSLESCTLASDVHYTHCPTTCSVNSDSTTCGAAWFNITLKCAWCSTTRQCTPPTMVCPNAASATTSAECTALYASDSGTTMYAWCATTAKCNTPNSIENTHCPVSSCTAISSQGSCVAAWATLFTNCHWCATTKACSNSTVCPTLASTTTSADCTALYDPTTGTSAQWCDSLNFCGAATDTEITNCPVTCASLTSATPCGNGWYNVSAHCRWCVATQTCNTPQAVCPVCTDATTEADCGSMWSLDNTRCYWCAPRKLCSAASVYNSTNVCKFCIQATSAGECGAIPLDSGTCTWCASIQQCLDTRLTGYVCPTSQSNNPYPTPIPGDVFLYMPTIALSWASLDRQPNPTVLQISVGLPATSPYERTNVAIYLAPTEAPLTAVDTLLYPLTYQSTTNSIDYYVRQMSVGELITTAYPKQYDIGTSIYLLSNVTAVWTEKVAPAVAVKEPTMWDRTVSHSMFFGVSIETTTNTDTTSITIVSDISVLYAIISSNEFRIDLTTGLAMSSFNIRTRPIMPDLFIKTDSISIQSHSPEINVSTPVIVSGNGENTQVWHVDVTYLVCTILPQTTFTIAFRLAHISDQTTISGTQYITVNIPAGSGGNCDIPFVDIGLTATQHTYTSGTTDYNELYNPITNTYWVGDPIAIKVDMETTTNSGLSILSTQVYGVILTGSAITPAALAEYGNSNAAEVFLRDTTSGAIIYNNPSYSFSERESSPDTPCASTSGCYMITANATKFANVGTSSLTLNIITTCKVTYNSGAVRLVKTTQSVIVPPTISTVSLYPKSVPKSGGLTNALSFILITFILSFYV